MAAELPSLDFDAFGERLRALAPEPLATEAIRALHAHYRELRRWNRRMSLVGPGTAGQVLRRHYGEALLGLSLLPPEGGSLVDLGSGGGFPGFVLAASRPDLRATLVEARQKKWSFLRSAARKAALPIRCLNARVDVPLPEGLPEVIDTLCLRALKLDAGVWRALLPRLGPRGRVLLWTGEAAPPAEELLEIRRELALPGSQHRRVLELVPRAGDPLPQVVRDRTSRDQPR